MKIRLTSKRAPDDGVRGVEYVLERLRAAGLEPRARGRGWSCRCPAHDDHRPSLDIDPGDDGRALVLCRSGCRTDDVLRAIDADSRRLFVSDKPEYQPKPRALPKHGNGSTYDYIDPDTGKVVFAKVRQVRGDGSKAFVVVGKVRPILYHAPEVRACDGWVWLVEGEKDADNLSEAFGVVATTTYEGAGQNKFRGEYADQLAGKMVAVLPDNDRPGYERAELIAQTLKGKAAECVIVALPGLPEKGDVSDWIAAGGTHSQLLDLLETSRGDDEQEPIRRAAYKPFPVKSMPPGCDGVIEHWCRHAHRPAEFYALPMLCAMSAAIGSTRLLDVGKLTPATVWACLVNQSGAGKSDGSRRAFGPIRKIDKRLSDEYQDARKKYEQDLASYKAARREYDRNGGELPIEPEPPVEPHLIVTDTTLAALLQVASTYERGTLVAPNELAAWFGSFDAYGGGGQSGIWIQLWDGTATKAIRKTSGTDEIRYPTVPVYGDIQPPVLTEQIRGTTHGASGLVARVLMAWPPCPRLQIRRPSRSDSPSDTVYYNLINRMFAMCRRDECGEPQVVRWSHGAWELFERWHNDGPESWSVRVNDTPEGLLRAWLSKLGPEYVYRLSLIDHVARWVCDPKRVRAAEIDDESVGRAIDLVEWFAAEHMRLLEVYESGGGGLEDAADMDDTEELIQVVSDRVGEWVKLRQIWMPRRRRYPRASDLRARLESIVEDDRMESREVTARNGRVSMEYRCNPI